MATLKISELSVGDWVGYNGKSYRTVIVDALDQTATIFGNDEQGDIHIEQLAPIPITAEILENNGFENMGSGLMRYEFELREKKYKIILGSFDEEVWFADFYFMRKKNIDSNIPLFYIHQLQHILRLAGVDKEINL